MRALLLRVVGLWLQRFSRFVAHAESPPVPAPLEPGARWVMHDQEFRACPAIAQRKADAPADFICAWPGVLEARCRRPRREHRAALARRCRIVGAAAGRRGSLAAAGHRRRPARAGRRARQRPALRLAPGSTTSARAFRGPNGRSRCACRARSASSRLSSTAARSRPCSATTTTSRSAAPKAPRPKRTASTCASIASSPTACRRR